MTHLRRAASRTIVALGLACTAAPSFAGVIASSTFPSDAQGWLIYDLKIPEDDNPPALLTATFAEYFSAGGNPHGYIQGFLSATNWWCFVAPPAYLGDKSKAYGGSFQFLMRSSTVDLGPRPGIFLVGGGMTLSYQTDPPQSDWAGVSAVLLPAGWRLNNWASGPEPTEAQMKAVLASLTEIYVTGEWTDANISKCDLDNVQLAGPPGEDLDLDADIDAADLGMLLGQWGPCRGLCAADINGDGVVDGSDLGLLLAAWGSCPFTGCPVATHSCYVQGAKGCADVDCCAAVCQNDANCCCIAWDAFCVEIASAQCAGCGNPSGGDCCSAHSTTYCSSAACCEMVCAGNSFCCQVAWDDVCANDAQLLSQCNCGG